MKKKFFFKLIQSIKNRPDGGRKLKKLILAGFFVVFTVGGLSIWAAYSVVSYGVNSLQQTLESPAVSTRIEQAKTEIRQIQFQPLACLSQTQTLFALGPWLEQPIAEVLQRLKVACFKSNLETKCDSLECSQNRI